MKERSQPQAAERFVNAWRGPIEDRDQCHVECLLALWKNEQVLTEKPHLTSAVLRQTVAKAVARQKEPPLYLEDLFPDGEDDSRWNLVVNGPEESVVIDLSLDEFERFLSQQSRRGPEQARLFRLWRAGAENAEIAQAVGRSPRAVWHCLNDTIFPALRKFWEGP